MRELVRRLVRKVLGELHAENFLQEQKLNDLQSAITLSAIDIGITPATSFSLSPTLILHLLNDVQIHRRKCVLEFGTGLSTLYLARMLESFDLGVTVYSVDEDQQWQELIEAKLKSLGCKTNVQFVTSSIRQLDGKTWFDESRLNDALISRCKGKVDCVLVDAPSTIQRHDIRSHAADFLLDNEYLSERYSVFIDDTYRPAERDSARTWHDRLTGSKIADYQTYCVIARGDEYVSRPHCHGHRYRAKQYQKNYQLPTL